MLKVGVTGGIGSGKTLVCTAISAMGYPVYNSDMEAKLIVDNDIQVIRSIKELFGDDIYIDGKLARKKVAELVFSDKTLLDKLNSIVHPAVGFHFQEWIAGHSNCSIVVQEAAILFESGAYQYLDKIIGVIAPTEVKIERIKKRDNIDRDLVLYRMKNQIAEEELIKRCDFIINNNGSQLVVPQINTIFESLLNN